MASATENAAYARPRSSTPSGTRRRSLEAAGATDEDGMSATRVAQKQSGVPDHGRRLEATTLSNHWPGGG